MDKRFDVTSYIMGMNSAGGGGGGGSLIVGALRPDAELLKSWTYDKKFVEDESGTIPAYTSSSKRLKSADPLSTSDIPIDFSEYFYYVIYRVLIIPIYSSDTKSSAKQDYYYSVTAYETVCFKANEIKSINGTPYNNKWGYFHQQNATIQNVYWTSNSAIDINSNFSYGSSGISSGFSAPTLNLTSNNIVIKSPTLVIMGSNVVLNSTNWALLTDIRFQYDINLYRVPNTTNVKGWNIMSLNASMIDCINNHNGDL